MSRALELADGLEQSCSDYLPKHEMMEAAKLLRELQAEVERLTLYKNMADQYGLSWFGDMAALIAERDQLKSWKESVLTNVGAMEEHVHLRLNDFGYDAIQDFVDKVNVMVDGYRDRSTHLAAKLVEARSVLSAVFNDGLQTNMREWQHRAERVLAVTPAPLGGSDNG